MREMLNEALPQIGDIVIAHEPASPILWMVWEVPHAAQFGSSSKDQALQLAHGYARAHSVDLWCKDGGRVRLLERYRPGRIVQPIPQRSWVRA